MERPKLIVSCNILHQCSMDKYLNVGFDTEYPEDD